MVTVIWNTEGWLAALLPDGTAQVAARQTDGVWRVNDGMNWMMALGWASLKTLARLLWVAIDVVRDSKEQPVVVWGDPEPVTSLWGIMMADPWVQRDRATGRCRMLGDARALANMVECHPYLDPCQVGFRMPQPWATVPWWIPVVEPWSRTIVALATDYVPVVHSLRAPSVRSVTVLRVGGQATAVYTGIWRAGQGPLQDPVHRDGVIHPSDSNMDAWKSMVAALLLEDEETPDKVPVITDDTEDVVGWRGHTHHYNGETDPARVWRQDLDDGERQWVHAWAACCPSVWHHNGDHLCAGMRSMMWAMMEADLIVRDAPPTVMVEDVAEEDVVTSWPNIEDSARGLATKQEPEVIEVEDDDDHFLFHKMDGGGNVDERLVTTIIDELL